MKRLDDRARGEMIELAKIRELIDEAHREPDNYRLEIGAGVFRLAPGEARIMIGNMLRQYSTEVE